MVALRYAIDSAPIPTESYALPGGRGGLGESSSRHVSRSRSRCGSARRPSASLDTGDDVRDPCCSRYPRGHPLRLLPGPFSALNGFRLAGPDGSHPLHRVAIPELVTPYAGAVAGAIRIDCPIVVGEAIRGHLLVAAQRDIAARGAVLRLVGLRLVEQRKSEDHEIGSEDTGPPPPSPGWRPTAPCSRPCPSPSPPCPRPCGPGRPSSATSCCRLRDSARLLPISARPSWPGPSRPAGTWPWARMPGWRRPSTSSRTPTSSGRASAARAVCPCSTPCPSRTVRPSG